MSRRLGTWQREILAALKRGTALLRLGGETGAQTSAILRAARGLERAGKCVVVRLWNDDHTAVAPYAAPPDLTIQGMPVKELSVEHVTHGTPSALLGSIPPLTPA